MNLKCMFDAFVSHEQQRLNTFTHICQTAVFYWQQKKKSLQQRLVLFPIKSIEISRQLKKTKLDKCGCS